MKRHGMSGKVKVFAILLVALALLASCSREKSTTDTLAVSVKNGTYIKTVSQSNAGDTDGKSEFAITGAAVSFDKDGKVVSCELDAADIAVKYTAAGKAVPVSDFATKRELGDRYGMKAAGAKAEWYEQADAFEKVVEGKTVDEIKRLVAEGGRGVDEVITAGCTISVEDFVKAIEKAAKN